DFFVEDLEPAPKSLETVHVTQFFHIGMFAQILGMVDDRRFQCQLSVVAPEESERNENLVLSPRHTALSEGCTVEHIGCTAEGADVAEPGLDPIKQRDLSPVAIVTEQLLASLRPVLGREGVVGQVEFGGLVLVHASILQDAAARSQRFFSSSLDARPRTPSPTLPGARPSAWPHSLHWRVLLKAEHEPGAHPWCW